MVVLRGISARLAPLNIDWFSVFHLFFHQFWEYNYQYKLKAKKNVIWNYFIWNKSKKIIETIHRFKLLSFFVLIWNKIFSKKYDFCWNFFAKSFTVLFVSLKRKFFVSLGKARKILHIIELCIKMRCFLVFSKSVQFVYCRWRTKFNFF